MLPGEVPSRQVRQSLRRFLARASALPVIALFAGTSFSSAQAPPASSACTQPLSEPITRLEFAGSHPTLSRDGCWLFVLTNRPPTEGGPGVAVLRRADGTFRQVRVVPAPFSAPLSGMVLTNDQKLLIVAAAGSLTFIDLAQATSDGGDAVVGRTTAPGAFRLGVTRDDRFLFVPQFNLSRIAIFNLERARQEGFTADSLTPSIVPAGTNPITALAAPGGRHVYVTNGVAPDVLAGALTCGKQREGAVQSIDVHEAMADPDRATVGWIFPTGCGTNAVTLSPDGFRLSNTAAGDIFDAAASGARLLVFDTTPGREATPPSRVGSVPVPPGPVAVVDTGDRLIVGFQAQGEQQGNLLVIDPAQVAAGPAAVIGTIPHAAGHLTLSADRRTLVAGSSLRGGIALIDLERVTVQPIAR